MKKRKTTGRKAAPRKGSETTAGLRKKQTKAPPPPRWLAPRPFFGSAVAASQKAGSGGSSGVNVTMAGCDLGIDKDGFRQESQKAPTPADNRFSWIHGGAQPDLTLPHDMTDDAGNPIPEADPWPNYWTMLVNVSPKDLAKQIKFEKHGDEPWCVDYVVAGRDTTKGEVRVRITAKVPTTAIKKNGKRVRRKTGALIVAKYKGVKVAKANFYVIRPEFLNRKPTVIVPDTLIAPAQIRVCAEYEGQGVDPNFNQHMAPPEQTFWDNFFFQWIAVPVCDQYWQQLAPFYSGSSVSESGGWIAWSQGPTYLDPVGITYARWRSAPVDPLGYAGIEFFELGLTPPAPPLPYQDIRPLPWQDTHQYVIRVAGWVLDNGAPLKRSLKVSDVVPSSPNPGPLPAQLHYTLKWVP